MAQPGNIFTEIVPICIVIERSHITRLHALFRAFSAYIDRQAAAILDNANKYLTFVLQYVYVVATTLLE